MHKTLHLRSALTVGASVFALATAGQAYAATAAAEAASTGGGTTIGELVVTAERREESLQDTPIAVSAFSSATLKAQRLDGGENLEIAIPNANYSRSNFGGYNFQIRGIGSKVVGAGGATGVGF